MSNETNVDRVFEAVLEMAAKDIVSLAEVRQTFDNLSCGHGDFAAVLKIVLLRLLKAGVELGRANNQSGNYVEFIGWQGSSETKIEKAIALISSDIHDAEFGVWLALRSNVDRYERC
ncbi:MAG: hypothetical protein JNN07_19265 [Verrucomicrobiales bacterium]|nr:hypothetical protein [Verrucomicrobiales bacterium]